jgi:hypothetical protein
MDNKEIRKRLKTLATRTMQSYPDVNCGGCCVFAAAVATELERLNVPYEVITCGSPSTNLNDNRPKYNTMDQWEWAGANFTHVGIRLTLDGVTYTYDSEAFIRRKFKFGVRGTGYFGLPERWQSAAGGLTAQEATQLADEGSWNRAFYNKENVEGVRKLVKEVFQ